MSLYDDRRLQPKALAGYFKSICELQFSSALIALGQMYLTFLPSLSHSFPFCTSTCLLSSSSPVFFSGEPSFMFTSQSLIPGRSASPSSLGTDRLCHLLLNNPPACSVPLWQAGRWINHCHRPSPQHLLLKNERGRLNISCSQLLGSWQIFTILRSYENSIQTQCVCKKWHI